MKSTFITVALLLMLSPDMASASRPEPVAVPGIAFSHHDWEVVCDNTRTCRAAGYSAEDVEEGASVLFQRQAGAGQAISAWIQVVDGGVDATSGNGLRLRIGKRLYGRLQEDAANEGQFLVPADQLTALLEAVVGVTPVAVIDGTGRARPISGRGATAVLLKMDEAQGRVGTPEALVRKGTKPASIALPALPMPVVLAAATWPTRSFDNPLPVSPALRQAVEQAFVALGDACEEPQAGEPSIPIEAQPLDDRHLLVSVPCWVAAYNSSHAYWVSGTDAPHGLTLVTTEANDYDNGVLESTSKGRGIGDCFYTEEWVWDGARFAPTLSRSTGQCRGQAGGFWSLPTWQVDVR